MSQWSTPNSFVSVSQNFDVNSLSLSDVIHFGIPWFVMIIFRNNHAISVAIMVSFASLIWMYFVNQSINTTIKSYSCDISSCVMKSTVIHFYRCSGASTDCIFPQGLCLAGLSYSHVSHFVIYCKTIFHRFGI